ncbi:MAG: hypothetical protein ACYCU0_11640 [Solirubrobacteraceae bacterium]
MPAARISVRPAATAVTTLALAGAALFAPLASVASAHPAKSSKATKVTVQAVGKPPAEKRLLDKTVGLTGAAIKRDGHSCSGTSALGALQLATKGRWSGTWDAQYSDWEITKIAGLSLPFKSKSSANWYWALYVGGKEASAGVCETTPKAGQTVLFKAACYGKACPKAKKTVRAQGLYADARRG